jgi:membrane glycosyltransferase
MHLPALNPDTIIAAILAAGALYGALGGMVRVRNLILSIYVGIVLAETLGALVAPMVKSLGTDQIQLILLGIPVILFALPHHRAHVQKGSMLVNLVTGLLSGAFLVVAALHVLPPSTVTQASSGSLFITSLSNLYIWFVIGMPLAALLPHALHGRGRRGHHG